MKQRLPRHPLALGLCKWGPLPGSADIWLMWDGPGSGITMYPRDPEKSPSPPCRPVLHSSANGTYHTLKQAQRAVEAFVAAGVLAGADET